MKREKITELRLSNQDVAILYEPNGLDAIRMCLMTISKNQNAIEYLVTNLVEINGVNKEVKYFETLQYNETLEILNILSLFMNKLEI